MARVKNKPVDPEVAAATAAADIAGRKLVAGILSRVGRPDDFIKADARHLWDNKYRINIWATVDGQARIVHSEFISA